MMKTVDLYTLVLFELAEHKKYVKPVQVDLIIKRSGQKIMSVDISL